MSKRRPQVFISGARQDEPLARELAAALEDAGIHAWWDGLIAPGENWAQAIATALDDSEALVFLISPEWTESRYAAHELDVALSGSRFAQRVFPIIVRPGGRLPWVLTPYVVGELSAKRPQKRELSELAEKIAAGVTGANVQSHAGATPEKAR